jgi:xanthine/uracil permease
MLIIGLSNISLDFGVFVMPSIVLAALVGIILNFIWNVIEKELNKNLTIKAE